MLWHNMLNFQINHMTEFFKSSSWSKKIMKPTFRRFQAPIRDPKTAHGVSRRGPINNVNATIYPVKITISKPEKSQSQPHGSPGCCGDRHDSVCVTCFKCANGNNVL